MDNNLLKQQQAFKRNLTARLSEAASLRPTTSQQQTAQPTSAESRQSESYYQNGRHINSFVHQAISILKQHERALTLGEFEKISGIALSQNPELLGKICRNERISFQGGMLAYNPPYKVRSKEDLLSLLRERRSTGGIRAADLKEGGFAGIEKVIGEMVRMGEVLCIQPRDEASRILFYNETRLVCPVDPDIVALWAGVRIPQNQDSLDAELIKCGLRSVAVEEEEKVDLQKAASGQKPSRRTAAFNRRTKFTNVHIPGFDPSKLMPPQK